MQQCIKKITDKIIETAKNENDQLMEIVNNNSNLGIFHMPELAFAYKCGKHIMQNKNNIFGDNIPQWCREVDLGNGGPSDLVFIFDNGYKIVIEFKMRDKVDAYIFDLEKLSKLENEKTIKLFCVITDTMKKDLPFDGRIKKINNFKTVYELDFQSFKTKQTWYESDVYASIGIWEII